MLLVAAFHAQAADPAVDHASGKVYRIDGGKRTQLFTMNGVSRVSPGGRLQYETAYLDLDGKLALTESASFDKGSGGRLQAFTIRQHQLGELYELVVDGGKLLYATTKADGSKHSKQQDLPPRLVVGASFRAFIREHWEELDSGKRIDVQLVVIDRQDTYDFIFSKLDEGIMRMKAKSIFVNAVVGPLDFAFDDEGSRLLTVRGRMLPMFKDGAKFKDFDGELVFDR